MIGYPKNEDDLDEIFGAVEPSGPRLLVDPPYSPREIRELVEEELPSADDLSQQQFVEAVNLLHTDTSKYPQFPWRDLAELSGPMVPEDLILVAARTGGGKSLFLQNLFDAMICAGRFGLYAGLEQTPRILRIKWACLRAGIPPRLVLATRDHERGSPAWTDAMGRVQAELAWQKSPAIKQRAHFSGTRKIDRKLLRSWTQWAVDQACDFVVIDHVDRIDHGDGRNPFHELSETIRLAKELAVEHRIVMLMATQVGRPADALSAFMPPALHELRGAGTKEEEADTVLGIYRPLRPDVKDDELKRVRQALLSRDAVIEPNVMGIQLLKHRLDGVVAHQTVKLAVEHGRLLHLPERHQHSATYDGLRRL